jgi:hypothetical protein
MYIFRKIEYIYMYVFCVELFAFKKPEDCAKIRSYIVQI